MAPPALAALALALALALATMPRAARAATIGRFGADATCTGAPASTYRVYGKHCYFESKQWGTSATGWLFNLGTAPIVHSSALASCAPGALTMTRWDTVAAPYATVGCAAEAGTVVTSVTLQLGVCVLDPSDPDAPAGPNYVRLLEDTCLGGALDEFLNLKIYYSGTCAQSGLAFQSTYYSGASGSCEETTVPEFLVAGSYARYNLSYTNANGGSYVTNWYSYADATCSTAPIGNFPLLLESCTPIFNGVGGAFLTRPPDYPTAVTLPSPSPTPSASPSPQAAVPGALNGGGGSASGGGVGGGGNAGLAGLAALVVLPIGAAAWWYFTKDTMTRRKAAPAAQSSGSMMSMNPIIRV